MQIDFDEKNKKINIRDDLKSQYLLIKVTLFILLGNALIILATAVNSGFGLFDFIWILLGIMAIYVLYILFVKKTANSELFVSEINCLNIVQKRNSTHFSLELKNGKERNLAVFSNDEDEKRLIQLCNKAGIKKKK